MELSITRPDDWHLHLRDGELLEVVVPHSSQHFGRAIVMLNLRPPITTTAAAMAYRQSILKALPENSDFTPLMTLYLTDTTSSDEIKLASEFSSLYMWYILLRKTWLVLFRTNSHFDVLGSKECIE